MEIMAVQNGLSQALTLMGDALKLTDVISLPSEKERLPSRTRLERTDQQIKAS
jgi:hypothetical protein